jgi:hypothetical protein
MSSQQRPVPLHRPTPPGHVLLQAGEYQGAASQRAPVLAAHDDPAATVRTPIRLKTADPTTFRGRPRDVPRQHTHSSGGWIAGTQGVSMSILFLVGRERRRMPTRSRVLA